MVKVSLREVSKKFREVVAVDVVSFDVKEGELFFLLGPSGCGKTTTLRLVAGFYKPDAGEVYFDDHLVNEVPPYKRNTGMVFQNYALWPHMTAYDNIIYGLKVRDISMSERVKRAKEVLDIVKMREFATRYPNQLSGGQQQRIALARAIVIEPDVLLLDEPLSNLDAKLRIETRIEIKRIQKELKITTLYVTHDQEEALSMADRIAVMDEGKIEQIGPPRQIYNNPRSQFIASFIGETNTIQGKIKAIDKVRNLLIINTASGEEIEVKSAYDNLSIGQKVTCSIRPEHIQLLKKTMTGANVDHLYEAKIRYLTYYGVIEHYILDSFGGQDLKVTNYNPKEHIHEEGDTVLITFKPEDVNIFPL